MGIFFQKHCKDNWRDLSSRTTKFYNFVYPENFEWCIAKFYLNDFNDKQRDYFKQFFEELKKGIDAEQDVVRIKYIPQYTTYKAVQEYNFADKGYIDAYKGEIKWILQQFRQWTTLFRDYGHGTEPIFRRNYIDFPNAPIYKKEIQLIADEIERLDKKPITKKSEDKTLACIYELRLEEQSKVYYLREYLNNQPTEFEKRFQSDSDNIKIMKTLYNADNAFIPYKKIGFASRQRTFIDICSPKGILNKEVFDRYFTIEKRAIQFTPQVELSSF